MGIPFGGICQGESKIAVCGRSLRRLLREGQGRGGGGLALRGDDAPLARSIMCPSSPTRHARMLLAPSAGRGAPTARFTPPRYTVMRGVDREYGKGGTERVWKRCLMKDTTFFTTVPRRMIFRRSCAVSTPSNAVGSLRHQTPWEEHLRVRLLLPTRSSHLFPKILPLLRTHLLLVAVYRGGARKLSGRKQPQVSSRRVFLRRARGPGLP